MNDRLERRAAWSRVHAILLGRGRSIAQMRARAGAWTRPGLLVGKLSVNRQEGAVEGAGGASAPRNFSTCFPSHG